MNYLIPEEIKNQILELKKTMERIKLDGLNFEYNQNPYDVSATKTTFEELVKIMVDADMAKVAVEKAGEQIRTNLVEYLEKGIVK